MQKYRYFIIYIVIFISFLLAGCSNKNNIKYNIENNTDTQNVYVLKVKNGYTGAIPQITYGQAFENFFSDFTWNYLEEKTGEKLVEFIGNCQYMGSGVIACFKFTFDNNGENFKQSSLNLNDVPQSGIVSSSLIYKIFEDYSEKFNISLDEKTGSILREELQMENNENQDKEKKEKENQAKDENNNSYYSENNKDGKKDYEIVANNPNDKEYIFPKSDKEKLTVKMVKNLSKKERRLAINEIYARYGRKFNDESLQKYFNSKSWYNGTINPDNFDENVFNETEKYNIRILTKYK